MDAGGGKKKRKFDAKTFAVKDGKGNIHVAVEVLVYTRKDEGYDELNRMFTSLTSDQSVTLDTEWCLIEPQNSSPPQPRRQG